MSCVARLPVSVDAICLSSNEGICDELDGKGGGKGDAQSQQQHSYAGAIRHGQLLSRSRAGCEG
jgi:hypothetical protein